MDDYIKSHEFSSKNRKAIEKSKKCGCFYCLKIFEPDEIENWLSEGDGTALCPFCGTDSVIGDSSGFEISEEFLAKMKKHWF